MAKILFHRHLTEDGIEGLALMPVGNPSLELGEATDILACLSPELQRPVCIALTGYHSSIFLGEPIERITNEIGSLGTNEIPPCPCGYRSDPRRACTCTPPQVEKYLGRISGPLLDRIDLHVEVPAVPFAQLSEAPPGPTSADLLAEVLRARARQAERFGPKGPSVNGRMTPRQVRKFCPLKPDSAALLKGAMEELGLSARAHDKILRVARTMGDLDGSDHIQPQHVAEAVGFRSLDRSVWA